MTNVLVFTSLFPNSTTPELGSFIKKRMAAFHRKENRNIVVVAPVPYFPPLKALPQYYRFSQIPYTEEIDGMLVYHPRYPLIPKISMAFHGWLMYLFSLPLVRKLHRQWRFHLIDAHFVYPDGMAGQLLGKKIQLPVVVSARGSDITEFLKYPVIRPQIIRTLAKADAVISVSQGLKEVMEKQVCYPQKIHVIPNGIDPDAFYFKERKTAQSTLGMECTGPVILSVGALIPRKGHNFTIDAVHLLSQDFPDLSLYIIGSGPEQLSLRNQIGKLQLEGRVHLLGQIPNDQLMDWYNSANVFCLSSSREGWANASTEALCCGVPCVVTKAEGTAMDELVVHGQNGFVVKRDAASIARGLKTALTKQWDRGAISRAISFRTWDKVAHEVDGVFVEVIQAHGRKTYSRKRW